MADFKEHMSRHLHSARQWLTQAEDAFAKNRDVRGELDLLLAQAELQHVRERNRSRQWRYKYPLLRHGLALGLAAAVAAVGFGGSFWWSQYRAQSLVPAERSGVNSNAAALVPIQLNVPTEPTHIEPTHSEQHQPIKTAAPSTPVSQHSQPTPSRQEVRSIKTRPADKEMVLPAEQMQQLVRAAGKSLRGQ